MSSQATISDRLRRILLANGIVTLLYASDLFLFNNWLAGVLYQPDTQLLGFPMAMVIAELGIALALFAVFLCWISRRAGTSRRMGWFVAFADAGWVGLSVIYAVAASAVLTGWGVAFVLAQAAITAVFATLEIRELQASAPDSELQPDLIAG